MLTQKRRLTLVVDQRVAARLEGNRSSCASCRILPGVPARPLERDPAGDRREKISLCLRTDTESEALDTFENRRKAKEPKGGEPCVMDSVEG
jgi:hypothetical protein